MNQRRVIRLFRFACAIDFGFAVLGAGAATSAGAQALTVLPVTIAMGPGQLATVINVINEGDVDTSIQIRAYSWSQRDDADQLIESAAVLASPPLATIAPHSRQVVRLVLRQAPSGREDTYRVILDQIPAPGEAGTVRLALRLSLPVFVQPRTLTASRLAFTINSEGRRSVLVASNAGTRHETLRQLVLVVAGGKPIPLATEGSPYILAGAVRRWPIPFAQSLPAGAALRLTAKSESGPIDVPLIVGATP